MALKGSAFLAIWNDILPESEAEFGEWHTKEHIPERVGIPGFLAGRRYVNWDNDVLRYFTLYEGEQLNVFNGEDYLQRLNAPTSWTQRMMPDFRNFIRGACRTVMSEGQGLGGALATFTLKSAEQVERVKTDGLCEQLLNMQGITGVHLGIANQEVTGVQSNERSMRSHTADHTFDLLLMVEGIGIKELSPKLSSIEEIAKTAFSQVDSPDTHIYHLHYMLTSE